MFVFLFSRPGGGAGPSIKLAHTEYYRTLSYALGYYTLVGDESYTRAYPLGPARDRAVGFLPPTPTDGDRAPESHVGDLGP